MNDEINNEMNKINIYNLYKYDKYDKLSIFNKITNTQMIIYFIIFIILLFTIKYVNNFSYIFVFICIFSIFIFYSQKISTVNYNLKIKEKEFYLKELDINPTSLSARDDELLKILYEAIFIKFKANHIYKKIITRIENFFVIYETLKQNINNIYLSKSNMIKPFKLQDSHRSILINDLRDQLELILKDIQTIIYVLPNDLIYLDAFYQFNQIIKSHLSRYYNRILSDYNFNDHTSQYLLIRSSEDKYDFLD